MKNALIVLGLFIGAACNQSQPTTTEEVKKEPAKAVDTVAEAPPVQYPFTAAYSSDWKIGDPNNAKLVLDFYRDIIDGKTDDLKKYLADSVIFQHYDRRAGKKSSDEVVKSLTEFRKKFKSLNEDFQAFVSLRSKDKNQDWVATWVKEIGVYPNGKTDSTFYQENWLLKDGKIQYVGGFARYNFR